MNSRRNILTKLGQAARKLPTLAFSAKHRTAKFRSTQSFARPNGTRALPTQAGGQYYFPNIIVYSHTGEKFRLFDDLIRDKVVTLNFMSIRGHQYFPVTEHLARIADHLGDRLGRDIYMLSITGDPDNDTPERLLTLAKACGANRKGWYFLTTASPHNVSAISDRLGLYRSTRNGLLGHPQRLVHFGNGGVGLWAAFGVDYAPELAVEP